MKKNYTIQTIHNYPDNGKHQECILSGGLPFEIRKGEDGYIWTDKSHKEHKYNMYKNPDKITKKWIVHLKEDANPSLQNIFEIHTSKNLDEVVDYCIKIYKESIALEIKRLKKELKNIIDKYD